MMVTNSSNATKSIQMRRGNKTIQAVTIGRRRDRTSSCSISMITCRIYYSRKARQGLCRLMARTST